MNQLRQQAGLDQTAALLRDERRKLCKLLSESRRRDWWLNLDNVCTLTNYLSEQCSSMEEVRNVVRWCISEPWKYRAEFVVAVCVKADAGRLQRLEAA